ncbi:MAG: vWA domain-containing protein, partial [Patescibacteria group bacterium]
FAVDATGSMSDEIEYLKVELKDIISRITQKRPDLELNLGSIFYRCEGNSYTTLTSPFSKNIDKTINFIKEREAGEGGTEAVEIALDEAVNGMQWSDNAIARLLFIILDEPPGSNTSKVEKLSEAIISAAKKGIRIIPIVASGMNYGSDKSLEYLMRSMALSTNGTYVFLTDDSGIGNAHTRPTTDKYTVELLNELLLRLFYQFTETPKCPDAELLTAIDSNISIENQIDIEEIEKEIRAEMS